MPPPPFARAAAMEMGGDENEAAVSRDERWAEVSRVCSVLIGTRCCFDVLGLQPLCSSVDVARAYMAASALVSPEAFEEEAAGAAGEEEAAGSVESKGKLRAVRKAQEAMEALTVSREKLQDCTQRLKYVDKQIGLLKRETTGLKCDQQAAAQKSDDISAHALDERIIMLEERLGRLNPAREPLRRRVLAYARSTGPDADDTNAVLLCESLRKGVQPGSTVTVGGLQSAKELNGRRGVVRGLQLTKSGEVGCIISFTESDSRSEERKLLRLQYVETVAPAATEGPKPGNPARPRGMRTTSLSPEAHKFSGSVGPADQEEQPGRMTPPPYQGNCDDDEKDEDDDEDDVIPFDEADVEPQSLWGADSEEDGEGAKPEKARVRGGGDGAAAPAKRRRKNVRA